MFFREKILLSRDAGNVGTCLTFLNGVAREQYRINEYIPRYQCVSSIYIYIYIYIYIHEGS